MSTIEVSLSEIRRQDQALRAWAWLPGDSALPDEPVAPAGPLAGLRFGVKDVMDVRGMPTCHGAALADMQAARFDAACVAMLRAAGALPIGKTVTAECAVVAPGPTRNPWNPAHTPGGSSSGSAAAVAAGMIPLALGTQTGGSIIRPAAFNGVVGFKPSFGRVPRTGMQVLCDSLDTIGWFTPDVGLARRVAEVFMADTTSLADKPPRVAVLKAGEAGSADEAAMAALSQAAHDLAAQGADVEWLEDGGLFSTALPLHGGIMAYEVARGLLPILQAEATALRPQTRAVIDKGLAIQADEYARLQQEREQLQASWREKLAGFDLILTPSAPGPAPQGLESTGSSIFNRTWSLLGWPCLHLPTSQTDDGLPLGVQCVGRPGQDLALLKLAQGLHPQLDRRLQQRPRPLAA